MLCIHRISHCLLLVNHLTVAPKEAMNIEDKFAIEELIARYNYSIDSGDYETWVDCWNEDGVMDGIGKYLVGIEAIREFANAYEQNHRSRIAGLRHFTVNIMSEINGDEATSRSYLQLVRTGTKGVQIIFYFMFLISQHTFPTRRKISFIGF